MELLLPDTMVPNSKIILHANYCDVALAASRAAQRTVEMIWSNSAKLGVLCTKEGRHLYGRLENNSPIINSPVEIHELGSTKTLEEQRKILSQFRVIFSGQWKAAMQSTVEAVGSAVYFFYSNNGIVAMYPDGSSFRLATICMQHAETMEQERACALINQYSKDQYSIFYEVFNEYQINQRRKNAPKDALDSDDDNQTIDTTFDEDDEEIEDQAIDIDDLTNYGESEIGKPPKLYGEEEDEETDGGGSVPLEGDTGSGEFGYDEDSVPF